MLLLAHTEHEHIHCGNGGVLLFYCLTLLLKAKLLNDSDVDVYAYKPMCIKLGKENERKLWNE